MQIATPVMVPYRASRWVDGQRIPGHDLHPGPTITKLTETRVEGYFWAPGNAVFNVARGKYGFRTGSGDSYYFSDIGKL